MNNPAHKPREIKLFNTLTRSIEAIEPLTLGEVKLYCCGPTVYNYQHIGNLRTYIFEDLLRRSLKFLGYKLLHVMNITDVGHLVGDGDEGEDKMMVAMRREKKKSYEIAEYYSNVFFDDCNKLKIEKPDIVCKATDHIAEMIELIQKIEANGFTYVAEGNVYFDISKSKDYGKLALLDLEKLKAGARIEVDINKRNPQDFVLWFTKSKFENQELQWESPWGRGYPGWHIECSAMANKYLGETFDIHCGGIDHVPVHHTNEIAQTEAATGKPWVRTWMHGEFLLINAEKMAKSSGNFFKLDDLVEKGFDPIIYRFLCIGSHYRSQLNFNWDILSNAKSAFDRIKSQVIKIKQESAGNLEALDATHAERFLYAICDDLSMPKALAEVSSVLNNKDLNSAQKLALLLSFDKILGLGMETWQEDQIEITGELQTLLDKRSTARAAKDWAGSDLVREEIKALGYEVKDIAGEQKLKRI